MRLSALAALMILTTVVLSACAQQTVAALDDHSAQFYGRNSTAPRPSYHYAHTTQPARTAGLAYTPASPSAYAYNPPPATAPTVTYDSVTSNDLPPPASLAAAASAAPVKNDTPFTTSAAWVWPVEGKVLEDFKTQGEGIVIAAKKGTPIHAAAAGEVAYVGSQMKDYGNLVIVRHPGGEMTSYAHASEIIVTKGDKVKKGDVLGYVGQTGRAPQPQLHFAVRSGEVTVDPMTRLPQSMASVQ